MIIQNKVNISLDPASISEVWAMHDETIIVLEDNNLNTLFGCEYVLLVKSANGLELRCCLDIQQNGDDAEDEASEKYASWFYQNHCFPVTLTENDKYAFKDVSILR